MFKVPDKRLTDRELIARDYSIADMASYPYGSADGKGFSHIPVEPHARHQRQRQSGSLPDKLADTLFLNSPHGFV